MMKKLLALAVIAPLLISCSSSTKKGETYNEAWVKDTNGFDILMGQFANNIENLWGYKEVLIAGPKDYVKYTDQFQTRSHINFDDGTITVETIAGTEPTAHLRRAIIKTLLMGDDPTSVDFISANTRFGSRVTPDKARCLAQRDAGSNWIPAPTARHQ